MDNANLTAALTLAAAGVRIFPAGIDKRPLIKNWQDIATTEQDIIADWWRRAPNALPAIPCGVNGLLVIDLDRHPDGADGVGAFKALVAQYGRLRSGIPMVLTPNNGAHLYFRQPDEGPLGNGRGSLPRGIDVRGVGGFVIGPGAVLPDGRGWVQVANRPPITQPAQLGWLESILKQPAEQPRDEHLVGETSDQRGRAYGEQALQEIGVGLAITKTGERNDRLYKAAFRLATMAARGWLAEAEIKNALHRACQANALFKDDGAPAFQRTFESGFREGLKLPHEDLKDREQHVGHEQVTSKTKDDEQPRREAKQGRATGNWDEPDWSIVEDRRGALPDFPPGVLSDKWENLLARVERGAGVTRGHVAVPLLAAVANLIGTARRIRASRSWSEPLTLWTAIVGFSGSGKTPGISVTKRALSLIESTRKERIAELQRRHDTKAQTAKAAAKSWKEEVEEAVKANLPPPQMPAAAVDPGMFVRPRLYVSDATIERHAVLLQARPRGMLLMSDELASLFLNMGRHSNGGSDKEFWLEAWNGHHYVVERMGRPAVAIDHLLIGMMGGFQPDKLARSFKGESDGMHARVLFAWPEEPAFHSLTDDVTEVEPDLVNALGRIIELPAGEDDVFAPRDVRLSADARSHFEQFRQFQHRGKDALDGREREWWAKGPSQVLRLAGTLCYLDWAIDGGPEPQTVEARFIEAAVRLWRDYFWPHSRAAIRQIGLTDHHAEARRVLRWIRAARHEVVSREDVRRDALSQRLNANEAQTLIDELVRAGWLREVTARAGEPGRPARRWEVNPKLLPQGTAEIAGSAEIGSVAA